MWQDLRDHSLYEPRLIGVHYNQKMEVSSFELAYSKLRDWPFENKPYYLKIGIADAVFMRVKDPRNKDNSLSTSQNEKTKHAIQETKYSNALVSNKPSAGKDGFYKQAKNIAQGFPFQFRERENVKNTPDAYDIYVMNGYKTVNDYIVIYFEFDSTRSILEKYNALAVPYSLEIPKNIQRKELTRAIVLTPVMLIADVVLTPYYIVRSIHEFNKAG
jgi:hypothetical protein